MSDILRNFMRPIGKSFIKIQYRTIPENISERGEHISDFKVIGQLSSFNFNY